MIKNFLCHNSNLKFPQELSKNHNIVDIKPLSKLKNLELLYISGNKINDITPLQKLQNLKKLELNDSVLTELHKEKEKLDYTLRPDNFISEEQKTKLKMHLPNCEFNPGIMSK